MKRAKIDGEDGLDTALAPSSSEAINDDPVLEAKHKIFLSHSGYDKVFVDPLCVALEARCHYPFFDIRGESLPPGEKFAKLILKAADQCEVFVVVVSDKYFMSKWPMIELNAFVKAVKAEKSIMKQKILPLFYTLSVSQLKEEKMKQRWFKRWKQFAREDPQGRIKVDEWKSALDELTQFNGSGNGQEDKKPGKYQNEVVQIICGSVTPDIKWEDSHVKGNAHEVVREKMLRVGASKSLNVKVVGLYGVGGIGKTTICKTLCNDLSNAFEGRVCHIELDSTSSHFKEFLQEVLIKLTRKSLEAIEKLDEGECKDILSKKLKEKKTFLAIDNVWDSYKSMQQAEVLLKGPFDEDSVILVTTRSQKTLERLGVDGGACFEMPKLGQEDAKDVFLHYACNGQQFTSEEDVRLVDKCVGRCYFSMGDGGGCHYHPLALEVLGRHLGRLGKTPSEWVSILSSVSKVNTEPVVFDVLRSSFDLLKPIEQALFMDVGIFL